MIERDFTGKSEDEVISAALDILKLKRDQVEIKVENIWYSYYNENNDVDSYDMPLKGMLKSGTIIYDVNGNLSKKQNSKSST